MTLLLSSGNQSSASWEKTELQQLQELYASW